MADVGLHDQGRSHYLHVRTPGGKRGEKREETPTGFMTHGRPQRRESTSAKTTNPRSREEPACSNGKKHRSRGAAWAKHQGEERFYLLQERAQKEGTNKKTTWDFLRWWNSRNFCLPERFVRSPLSGAAAGWGEKSARPEFRGAADTTRFRQDFFKRVPSEGRDGEKHEGRSFPTHQMWLPRLRADLLPGTARAASP